MPERLRTLRHCIFTGGVVEKNGICSAAFCESAALRGRTASLHPHPALRATFPRRVKASAVAGNFAAASKGFPLGKLSRSD